MIAAPASRHARFVGSLLLATLAIATAHSGCRSNGRRGNIAAAARSDPALAPSGTTPPAPAVAGGAHRGPPARVIIVGGGLAGLVTAYELQKRGIISHVIEAGGGFGGRVRTVEYPGGLRAELGLKELWGDNPLVKIAKDLGVKFDSEVQPAFSSVVLEGKLYPYVQDDLDGYLDTFLEEEEIPQLKAWLWDAKKLHEFATTSGLANARVRKLQGISFAAWVRDAELPTFAEHFVRMTIECELATDWNNFSALVGLLEFQVFLGDRVPNYHVRGGNSRLVEALAKAHTGPKTMLATVNGVKRFRRPDGRLGVRVTYLKNRKVATLEGDRVVLAVPFWRLHQIRMDPPLPKEVWQGILTLRRGQYTVVHLIMHKDARKLWDVYGASPFSILTDGPLGVIYGVEGKAPKKSKFEVFSLLVHGRAARAYHSAPREARLAQIKNRLDAIWPGISKYIHDSHIYTHHPAAIAVWPPGRSPIDESAETLREEQYGMYLVGDWLYSGHSDGAARSARRAARLIARALGVGAGKVGERRSR